MLMCDPDQDGQLHGQFSGTVLFFNCLNLGEHRFYQASAIENILDNTHSWHCTTQWSDIIYLYVDKRINQFSQD